MHRSPMKGKAPAKGAKNAKVIKNSKHRKKKQKQRKKEADSDLSDYEAEIAEELPADVSQKVQRLLKEANEEIATRQVGGADFLAKDPLLDLDLDQDSAGFLPESEALVNTGEIWSRLKELSTSRVTEEDALARLRPVYGEIGVYLAKYRSGGLPKAFKVLPKMTNWSELLALTRPQSWTPNAMHEAVRLFSSNMNEANAELFYRCVLLPAVRHDLSRSKALSHHYYEALIRAVFKPTAWFKGILLPLVEEGCTYREASVIGGVLRKVSIPVMHASAFIVQICRNQKWFGSTSFILSILFQKRFRLPVKVVKECLAYFCKFVDFHDHLPVIWHQSLYVFLHHYKHTLAEEDHELLRELLAKHRHPQIGPAIERLLTCTIHEVDM